jgi:hypothetical protein
MQQGGQPSALPRAHRALLFLRTLQDDDPTDDDLALIYVNAQEYYQVKRRKQNLTSGKLENT